MTVSIAPPGPLSLVPFVSVEDMMRLVLARGIERVLADLADYIEEDFRRWEASTRRRASPPIRPRA